jgi:yeast amino acid transporter
MSSDNYNDAEKNIGGAEPQRADWDVAAPHQEKWTTRFIDSFKRDPNAHVVKPGQLVSATEGHGKVSGFDHKAAAEATANSGLAHKLKARHMQMIAIGGSIGELSHGNSNSNSNERATANKFIGTGLFVTSGAALSNGGAASLVIAFIIIGVLMFCTVQALGELAVLFPVSGSFSAYSTRFLDPAWGFAMGWK